MAIECGVIAAIFVIMAITFFRTKRPKWAWATLPLILVPATQFVMAFLVTDLFGFSPSAYSRLVVAVVTVAISCAWIGIAANNFKSKTTKSTYIGITNLFNVLLAAIVIHNILYTMQV